MTVALIVVGWTILTSGGAVLLGRAVDLRDRRG